ncbi:28S ribosomal protein S5, mitochondrial [Chytridiales sp. JEL 0842]|nr:28S ribosomal protein S5, mitochondrial [Chytridiales sp. JEL 0842]
MVLVSTTQRFMAAQQPKMLNVLTMSRAGNTLGSSRGSLLMGRIPASCATSRLLLPAASSFATAASPPPPSSSSAPSATRSQQRQPRTPNPKRRNRDSTNPSSSASSSSSSASASSPSSSSLDSTVSSEVSESPADGLRPRRPPRFDKDGGNSTLPSNPPNLQRRVLHVRRVARVTSGGKVRSVSAIVVVGNGNGVGGYGEGRAMDVQGAVMKAVRQAEKNMLPIERFEHRTIFGNIDYYFHKVNLKLRAAPPGNGIIANNNIHEICRVLGISDLTAKVHGSRNPLNVIKATFEALQKQQTPVEIARSRGRKLVDIANAYYGGAGIGSRTTRSV